MKKPRPLALIKIIETQKNNFKKSYKKEIGEGPYVFLGEVPNMPGHCVLVDWKTGKVTCGHHTANFVELTDKEV